MISLRKNNAPNKKSLLILGKGDKDYTDRNPERVFQEALKSGMDVRRTDYGELEALKLFGGFKQETIVVMPFFPYNFWNEFCETPKDTGLYGTSRSTYELLDKFFKEKSSELKAELSNHQLEFVIPLEKAAFDRDKIATIELLQKNNIPTTTQIQTRDLEEILHKISINHGLMIKCRYGSEGKGITLLRKDEWLTNYKVEKRKLTNYGTYDKWEFTDITGKKSLLKQLLRHQVIIEEEITPPRVYGQLKFDTRTYVVDYQPIHFFVRINEAEKIVTNYSQGARILHNPNTKLPEGYCDSIKKISEQSARATELRFIGVDIMFSGCHKEPKVVEVQAFTDFPHKDYFDLAKYMVESSLFNSE